jgi:hypothetical protein
MDVFPEQDPPAIPMMKGPLDTKKLLSNGHRGDRCPVEYHARMAFREPYLPLFERLNLLR